MEAVAMEAYSSSSSSSSSALQGARGLKMQQPFHASLHSVRKPMTTKPWKKPIAPLPPPTPPKVYKVEPVNFRDLVQKLTGAPDHCMSQSQHQTLSLSLSSSAQLHDHQLPHQRLQRLAPPLLHVSAPPLMCGAEVSAPLHLLSGLDQTKTQDQKFSDNAIITSNSLGLNLLSPSSYNWCTFPILSPGTLSSLEQSSVP